MCPLFDALLALAVLLTAVRRADGSPEVALPAPPRPVAVARW